MPEDGDFKRLVRTRMLDTGEPYTAARSALVAERLSDPPVSERSRSLLGQFADPSQVEASRRHLLALSEAERRAAALEGLRHPDWRVRRTSAQILDRVDLTAEVVAALRRALDDDNPQVRRKAVHTLSCENCKPNGCVVDVRPLFERAVHDQSSLVRSMVVHVCSLHLFDQQWAIDLVMAVGASDPSPKLRSVAAEAVRSLAERWESDARRRTLPADLVKKTEQHAGRWVAIRDGRIVAVRNGQGRVFRRAVLGGAEAYWVAPEGALRPRIGGLMSEG